MTSVPPPSTPPSQGPPQGWYQDPQGSGLRWWDGAAWTEHTHEQMPAEPAPAEATGKAPAQEDDDLGLTIGGDDEPTGPEAAATPAASTEPAASTAAGASTAAAASSEPAASAGPPGAAPASTTTQPDGDAGATVPPRPDTTIPESGPASEGLRRYARLLILLAILVATLIAALFVFNGDDDDGGGGGGGGGSASEGDIIFADSQAQSAARTAQTAIETYSTDNGGSYEGATPQELAGIENTLEGTDLSVDAQEDTYAITVNSKTGGNSFTISRTSDGQVTLGCAEPGTGACPENGTWGN